MLCFALFFTVIGLIYHFVKKRYQYFDEREIQVDKPKFILGSLWRTILKQMHAAEDIQRFYHASDEDSRLAGLFNLLTPALLIKDPELIKILAIKEFDNFNDRPFAIPETVEPIFGRTLISLKGQKWRNMRAALSPAFTSSKIRDMCIFMSECGKQMTDFLVADYEEGKPLEVDARDLSLRFMSDVIANSIFGMTVDSFKQKDNVFLNIGKKFTNFNFVMIIKSIFAVSFPKTAKFFGLKFSDENVNQYIKNLVLNAMKEREENNIVRRDMINLLMEAKKGSLKHEKHTDEDAGFATVEESELGKQEVKQVWTDDDLVAQAILFFVAGFDTTSTGASFTLYELALNPEVQEKLINEIHISKSKHGDDVTYDVIQSMKYLDMVLSESLRKWPALPSVDRLCHKDVDIGPKSKNGSDNFTIKKGDWVWFPMYSLHRDPKYWSDPLKFDPERFSDQNKDKITPFTYLPFGAGPRNCIGSRFALLQMKVMLYHLLAKYRVEPSSRTNIPLVLEKGQFFMRSSGGFWLNFVKQ